MSQQDFNDKSGNGDQPSSGPVLSSHDRTKSIGTAEVSGNKVRIVRFKPGEKTENIQLCDNVGCAFNTNDKCKASGTECFGYSPLAISTNRGFSYRWTNHALSRWEERFGGIDKDLEFSSARLVGRKTRAKIKKLTPVNSEIYLSSKYKGRFCLLGRSNIVFVINGDSSAIVTAFHLYGY